MVGDKKTKPKKKTDPTKDPTKTEEAETPGEDVTKNPIDGEVETPEEERQRPRLTTEQFDKIMIGIDSMVKRVEGQQIIGVISTNLEMMNSKLDTVLRSLGQTNNSIMMLNRRIEGLTTDAYTPSPNPDVKTGPQQTLSTSTGSAVSVPRDLAGLVDVSNDRNTVKAKKWLDNDQFKRLDAALKTQGFKYIPDKDDRRWER